MPKDVLIYGPIYSDSAIEFHENVAEVQKDAPDEEIKIRINTEGGEPMYGWGMVAKISELPNKSVQVDGAAYSFGAFALCYCDKVSALDVSQFLLHRAAYSSWFESSEYFTEEIQQNLKQINDKLEKALRNKIDVAKLEALGKGTVKEIFSMEGRKDVFLNAIEAKKIGLISEIIKITPSIKAEVNTRLLTVAVKYEKIAAKYEADGQKPIAFEKEKKEEKAKIQKKIPMTAAEFKAENPEVYASIFADGKKAGVKEENDRVGAWTVFAHLDPEAVKKGIASTEAPSATQMSEFALKALSPEKLQAIKKDSEKKVETEEEDVDGKTALSMFESSFRASLGLKPKEKVKGVVLTGEAPKMTLVQA